MHLAEKNTTSGILGIYTITECDCSSLKAKIFAKMVENAFKTGAKNAKELLRQFNENFSVRKEVIKNLVPDSGLAAHAYSCVEIPPVDGVTGVPIPYDLNPRIQYAAVGTGTVAPVASNTQLGAEGYRSTITSTNNVNSVAYNTFFVGLNDANGIDISEFGLFCGAPDVTPNSGRLFSRVLITPVFQKTDEKTITVDVSHTFISV